MLGEVSDVELQGRLKELLSAGSYTEARVVAHLAEVDARRLHLHGSPSLFQYCLVDLGFSESEAWYRICAARAARKFPLIFELLERREVHLTAVALLAKHLTEENHRELLTEARGQTKQQILESLARRWPKADVSSSLRRISGRAVAAGPTGTLEPRSGETYRLQLNATRQLKAKLEEARDLMSHANPHGDLAVVVERALDVLIQKLKGRHFGQTGKHESKNGRRNVAAADAHESNSHSSSASDVFPTFSRASHPALPRVTELGPDASLSLDDLREPSAIDRGPHVQAAKSSVRKRLRIRQDVRRQIVERDGGSCCHVRPDGRRCAARAFLQLHHEEPWALGGADSADNLRWLCRAHNRLRAERELGIERVARVIELRRTEAKARRSAKSSESSAGTPKDEQSRSTRTRSHSGSSA